jgi:hypothetical protein
MRIYSGSMSLRICPELNAKKQKSSPTQPRRKKPAMKPRVICQQCGLSLLDRHVLRRHVGYHLYTVYSGVPRESVFLLGTFAKLTEASFGGQMVVCFITSFCSVAGQKTPDPGQNLDADPDPDPDPGEEGRGGGRTAKNVHPVSESTGSKCFWASRFRIWIHPKMSWIRNIA